VALLAEWSATDTGLWSGAALVITALGGWIVKMYRERASDRLKTAAQHEQDGRDDVRVRHEIRQEEEENALTQYRKLVKEQDSRMDRQDRKIEELNVRIGVLAEAERKCLRNYDRAVLWIKSAQNGMRGAGIPFDPFSEEDHE
jgi:HAMP domain-containing protein